MGIEKDAAAERSKNNIPAPGWAPPTREERAVFAAHVIRCSLPALAMNNGLPACLPAVLPSCHPDLLRGGLASSSYYADKWMIDMAVL